MARTYIETLHLMNNLGNRVLIDDITEEDLVNITTALEKQIPMSRVIIEGQYFCPKCKNLMKYPGYCGCGQKVY
nr:MAG TPA: DNA REPAIR HELICASE RAD25, SSL2, PRE-INITIATION COMPLEX, RNA POLYMERASE.0A [Caudoviricetes sp.]